MATKKKNNDIKKEKKKINNINSEFDFNIKRYAFVVFGVVIFICAFYFLTVYIVSKNKTDSNSNNTEDNINDEDLQTNTNNESFTTEHNLTSYNRDNKSFGLKNSSGSSKNNMTFKEFCVQADKFLTPIIFGENNEI